MISYFSALSLLFNNIKKSCFFDRFFYTEINDSLYRVSFFNILSLKKIPSCRNSAMDGYSFDFSKLIYNFDFISNRFFLIDIIKAGISIDFCGIDGDYIVEIMTGTRLPSNFSVVVKSEDIFLDIDNPFDIIINRRVFFNDNVRIIGEDFDVGDILLKKGDCISLSNIMALSSFGISRVAVLKNLKIFLICTGKEVVDSFVLDFNDFSVNNSLFNFFTSFFKKLGFSVNYFGVNLDCKNSFRRIISRILLENESSLIVTTGGVSKGKADFIPFVLSELNFSLLFHCVNIKPGKPVLTASYGGHYFFGLPGNPISSVIGFRFFVYPFLRFLSGFFFEEPFVAILDHDLFVFRKCDLFLKAFTYFCNSNFYVKIVENQQSFKIKSFVESNSFVFLRVGDSTMKGDTLKVFFYNPYG